MLKKSWIIVFRYLPTSIQIELYFLFEVLKWNWVLNTWRPQAFISCLTYVYIVCCLKDRISNFAVYSWNCFCCWRFIFLVHVALMEIPKRIKLKTFPQQISTKSSKENKEKIDIKMGKSKRYITKSSVFIPISQKKMH